MAARYELVTTVMSACDLENINGKNGDLRPYAVVWVDPAKKCSTEVDVENDVNPVWDEKLKIPLPYDKSINECTVHIHVVHAKSDGQDDTKPLIGWAKLPLTEVVDEVGIGGKFSRSLKLKSPSGKPHGKLEIKVAIKEIERYNNYDRYAPPYGQPALGRAKRYFPTPPPPYGSNYPPYGQPQYRYCQPYGAAPPPPYGSNYPPYRQPQYRYCQPYGAAPPPPRYPYSAPPPVYGAPPQPVYGAPPPSFHGLGYGLGYGIGYGLVNRFGHGHGSHNEGGYGHGSHNEGGYGHGSHNEGGYGHGSYNEGVYGQGLYSEGGYGQGSYDQSYDGYGQSSYGVERVEDDLAYDDGGFDDY